MSLLKRIFQFFYKEELIKENIVKVNIHTGDKSCICERNARGENISGWCSKHHEDWL